jgi:DNA-binding PadR family transcriptional regulator
MGNTHMNRARGRSRGLRGATLALIAERGGHGYELAHRLNVRLGPTWRVGPKQVYPILDELVRAGLATSAEEPNPDRPRQPRVVYRATEQATEVLHRWMQSPVEKEPERPDLVARIASATPADLAELTEAFDEYERDLQHLLAENAAASGSASSWSALLLSVVRGHTEAQLRGELRWLADARRRLVEFEDARRLGGSRRGDRGRCG